MNIKFYEKIDFKNIYVLIFIGLLFSISDKSYGQLLMQNFSSSATVSDYVSTTPNNTQFTSINATTGSTVSIVGERLEFARTSGGEGWFSRSVSFSTVPTTLMVQFNMEAMTTGGTQTTACLVKVGDGLNDIGTPLDANTTIFARFGINFTATAGQFSLRNIDAGMNSGNFTGKQTITFVMNKSGANLTYVAPTGTNRTLANNAYDVYIGTTLFINAAAALTPTVDLANFKFNFRSTINNTSLRIDNIYINSLNGTGSLPSGTFSIGENTGNFTSITNPGGIFNVLNNLGSIPTGGYTFQVTENLIAETGLNPLLQISGMVSGNEVKIVPNSADNRLISGNVNANDGLIRLNGADYVIFDGSFNCVSNSTSRCTEYLTFRNTNNSNSTNNAVFSFRNEATYNIIRNCIIEGATQSSSNNAGIIGFKGSSSGTEGNSYNTIQFNRIKNAPSNLPMQCITSSNNGGAVINKDNLIDNNYIYNFFGNTTTANVTSSAINISNADNWTISNNHVYQETTLITGTAGSPSSYTTIFFINSGAHSITGNYLGGSQPYCGGTPWTFNSGGSTTVYFRIQAIRLAVSNSAITTIQNNVIQNFSMTSQTVDNINDVSWVGITGGGRLSILNNTFGIQNSTGSITFNNTASRTNISIRVIDLTTTSQGVAINNNAIGGITANNTANGSIDVMAIRVAYSGTDIVNINNNVIGSQTTINSIQVPATISACFIRGIINNSTNGIVFIQGNQIVNLTNHSTNSTAFVNGIEQVNNSNAVISNNLIYQLSSESTATGVSDNTCAVSGLYLVATTNPNFTANDNTIYSLAANNSTNTSSTATGIFLSGGVNGHIYNNKIYNIINKATGTAPIAAGIIARNIGTGLYIYNNRISLGLQPVVGSGTSNPDPAMYIGIWNNFSSANRLYVIFNSVNIGGAASGGVYKTFGFFRGNNPWDAMPDASLVTTPLQVYNNIFQNARTGGTGSHYAIGIQDITAPDQAPCPTFTTDYSPDYNVYYASTATNLGEAGGVAKNFASWQTSFTPNIDTHSFDASPSGVPIAFVDVGIADMHLTVNDQRPDGKALPIATELGFPLTIDFDIDGEFRRSTDAGADELEQTMTFIGTSPNDNWHDPNNWLVVGSMPERNIVPNCADNVIVPSGKTVRVYNGGTQNPTNEPALFYTLTIQNGATIELQNGTVMNSCWYNDELAMNQVHKGEFQNNGVFIANGGTLNIAGRFTDNGNFQKGTSTVVMNKDRPTLNLECLEKYIHARNDDSKVSNIRGTAHTNFYNLVIYSNESLASNNTTKDDAFSGNTTIVGSKNVFVGDATSDLGYLDIQGVNLGSGGWLNLNGNKLTLEGDLTENNGTITGSTTSKLHIFGKGNLTGTLKFTDIDTDGFEDFEEVVMNRTNNGLAVLGNKSVRISNIGFLDLTAGRLKTGVVPTTFEVNVTNTNAGSSVINYNPLGYNNSGWVWGRLRRSILGTASYKYPIGDGTRYQLIDIDITMALGTTSNILGYFNPNDAPGSVNLTEGGITYNSLCTNGFWEMTPNIQPSSGSFNINLFPVNITCIGAPINFAKSPSGAGTYSFGGSLPVTPIRRSGFTNFSDITLISPSVILPVELISFQALAQENAALLTWETVWERGNDYFEVQKSTNGKNFFGIGRVQGKGTSQNKNFYQLIDNEPFKGINYYRLKQVDLDGKVNYSKIISLYFSGGEEIFNIFPNPSTDLDIAILLSAKAGNLLHIKVIDANGKNIFAENQVYMGDKISLQSDRQIAKGIYLVVVQNITTGSIQSKKLIVE
ncbi:beta strand repeat-containing protein [Thermoflexibacter ruber]|uniref:Por secretion system C-terminal sorting domain-containing protein n=1 Tax=Thermoflexibacter ruber TaxID=1003 RepID=A0A1I2DMG7_9BACT|nr:T9SS type A sorting domain-containing protein [Thermoflexibacter ruber]SFE81501.1 hypothetical protein SAMN04488541_100774 [Thermoflexibacter ruber]